MKSMSDIRRIIVLLFLSVAIILAACKPQEPLGDRPGMVLVRGGSFIMGEQGGKDNPAHKVTVSSFYIGIHEVTLSSWRQFTLEELTNFNWKNEDFLYLGRIQSLKENDARPAYYMDWYEAVRFCNWLSRKHGLRPAYVLKKRLDTKWDIATQSVLRPEVEWDRKASGYRLPTEAEWEYAARGGKLSKGYVYAGSNDLEEVAWYRRDGELPGPLHPVREKKPNEIGLYDMSGNVSEFCWDYYSSDYYRKSPEHNPTGPKRGYLVKEEIEANADLDPKSIPDSKAVRGGNCQDRKEWGSYRTTTRLLFYDYRSNLVGIRLVCNASAP